MPESRTPRGERIERTRYGERQHPTADADESVRYGSPHHDPDPCDPDVAERLGHEDRRWRGYRREDDTDDATGDAASVRRTRSLA